MLGSVSVSGYPTLAEYRLELRPGTVTDQMLPGWSYGEWMRGWRFVPLRRYSGA